MPHPRTPPALLRQQIAASGSGPLAWSQIFVTSLVKEIWNDNMWPYQEMLMTDAFKSYRQILSDVTLSPTMGHYLDMANNGKGNTVSGDRVGQTCASGTF